MIYDCPPNRLHHCTRSSHSTSRSRSTMTTKLAHPFKDAAIAAQLPALDAAQQQLVDEFHQWSQAQPKFPHFSRAHAHQFLHACLWDVRAARKSMQKYCSIRAATPTLFAQRDPLLPAMQDVLNLA